MADDNRYLIETYDSSQRLLGGTSPVVRAAVRSVSAHRFLSFSVSHELSSRSLRISLKT